MHCQPVKPFPPDEGQQVFPVAHIWQGFEVPMVFPFAQLKAIRLACSTVKLLVKKEACSCVQLRGQACEAASLDQMLLCLLWGVWDSKHRHVMLLMHTHSNDGMMQGSWYAGKTRLDCP